VYQGTTIKFGRVRFKIKKLVIDPKERFNSHMAKNEDDKLAQSVLTSNMDNTQPDVDARMTMNFTREAVNFGGEIMIKPDSEKDDALKNKLLLLKDI